jgi:hypothetical protein
VRNPALPTARWVVRRESRASGRGIATRRMGRRRSSASGYVHRVPAQPPGLEESRTLPLGIASQVVSAPTSPITAFSRNTGRASRISKSSGELKQDSRLLPRATTWIDPRAPPGAGAGASPPAGWGGGDHPPGDKASSCSCSKPAPEESRTLPLGIISQVVSAPTSPIIYE